MFFFFSLIPTTIFVVVGYFVLFASARANGGVRTFGRVLAIWIFVVAALPPLAGAYATITGIHPFTGMMADHAAWHESAAGTSAGR